MALGYLLSEDDTNYCQFLADYFSAIPGITPQKVRQEIEAENELSKVGLCSTIVFKSEMAHLQETEIHL